MSRVLQTWTDGKCRGLDLWARLPEEENLGDTAVLTIDPKVAGEVKANLGKKCFAFIGEFDKQMGDQKQPDPIVKPQTHLLLGRCRIPLPDSPPVGCSSCMAGRKTACNS